MAKKIQSGACAAITQHSVGLRYLELNGKPGSFKIARQASIPFAREGSADSISSLLLKEISAFNAPVVFGLPMRESMIRVIEYPRMPVEDARQALQFDFDRLFTWPYSECSVDVCEVESPLTSSDDKMSMLVAACRNEHIFKIMHIAEGTRMTLKAIEPMNVAVLRTIIGHNMNREDEPWCSVYSDTDGIHFAFVSNDNGLLYRSSPAGISGIIDPEDKESVEKAASEIQRTISYITTQFKGVSVGLLVLTGAIGNPEVAQLIESAVGLRVETVDIYERCGISGEISDGFEPALGLCLRSFM